MKKNKYIGLISLIVLIVSFFAAILIVNAADWTVSSNAWETAQGYKLTIIKYDYTTKSQQPLASILLYTSTLVSDINMELPGPVPTKIEELGFDGVYLIGSQGITTSCTDQAAIVDSDTKSPLQDKMGYNITTDEYATSYRRVTYKGEDIIYEDAYVNSFLEENAGPSTIDSLVSKYAGTKDLVLTNFGVYIIPEEVDMYYVSAEPVQRLVNKDKDDLTIYDSYLQHEFIHTYVESDAWSSGTWTSREVEYTICGGNCHIECDGGDCAREDSTDIPSACVTASSQSDCFSKASAAYGSAQANAWLTCCNTSIGKKTVYSLAKQKCGTKTHYLFFGYYGYGASRIVTSRAMHLGLSYDGYYPTATDTEHLSRSQNVKEEHAECVLDSNDNCTDVYEYYIGPDLPKALVGTVSSNVFNFVNVSGVEGIEHYYWIDVPNPGDVETCVEVCQEVGSQNSDEYLRCSEHFCEAYVDYDLEGSQRERKKRCMLERCHYVYGKEPDTGNEPFDFPNYKYHSESVNSCNNSDPFSIYKGRELTNNTSICNIDSNTGNEMQYVPGYFEECISDEVTDYDGNPRNDTAFDFRTYIVKTCLESTAMEFPNLSGQTFLAGEGIGYFVNQDSQRECRYYMNLEQWKFDYASISEKDTARKKRLKYIYDTFNNSLNESYDGKQSPYYYSGEVDFVEEAYGTIDINSETYDNSKTSVDSAVAEVVLNQQINPEPEILKVLDSSNYDYSDIYFSGDSLTLVEENTISYINGVNRFIKQSYYFATYGFDKECLTTEGDSNIYKADENGICYKIDRGSEELDPYEGSNVHYTALDATANEDFTTGGHHGFTTSALTVKDATGAIYYQNTESCNYRVAREGGGCVVSYKSVDSSTNNISVTVTEDGPKLPGETRSFSLNIYKKVGENRVLVYSGEGKNHTVTLDDDPKINYYFDGIMTSSILGEVYCSNKYNANIIIIEGDDCKQTYKPVQLVEISNYCASNWNTDVNNFSGPNSCIKFCSNGCPEDCLSRETLETYCETNYSNLGVDNEAQCVNYCYCAVEGDYVFRPISNIDPFPDRSAGPNWVGLEELITQDDEDVSSVTGINANQTVEYVLDFTSSTIRSIRSDSERIKAEGNSPYTDLIYKSNSKPTTCRMVGGQRVCDTGAVSEYKSKFIHDSDPLNGGFSDIFLNETLNSGGRTVAIEYTPGTDFEHLQ